MKRSRLRIRPRAHETDAALALAWWREVAKGKRCVLCGSKRDVHGHHIISQQVLRQEFPRGVIWRTSREDDSEERWEKAYAHDLQEWVGGQYRSPEELRWDVRNGLAVCGVDHQLHESAARKIPLAVLPPGAFEFARELRLEHRLGPRFYSQPTNLAEAREED